MYKLQYTHYKHNLDTVQGGCVAYYNLYIVTCTL